MRERERERGSNKRDLKKNKYGVLLKIFSVQNDEHSIKIYNQL